MGTRPADNSESYPIDSHLFGLILEGKWRAVESSRTAIAPIERRLSQVRTMLRRFDCMESTLVPKVREN